MRWGDIPWRPPISTLRWFAAIWLSWFFAIGCWVWLYRGNRNEALVLFLVALPIGLIGLIRPAAIRVVYVAATIATFPLGWLVSRLLLGLVFYCLFAPLAIIFRLSGRDALGLQFQSGLRSYWAEKPESNDLRSYFRQS